MADLKTDYVDDVLDTTQNTRRKYNMITNADGTVSFEDVTEYLTEGDSYGSAEVNEQNEAINQLNTDLTEKVSGFADTIYSAITGLGYDSANKKIGLKVGADTVIPFSKGDFNVVITGRMISRCYINNSSGFYEGTNSTTQYTITVYIRDGKYNSYTISGNATQTGAITSPDWRAYSRAELYVDRISVTEV